MARPEYWLAKYGERLLHPGLIRRPATAAAI